jgi:hypothetical protein
MSAFGEKALARPPSAEASAAPELSFADGSDPNSEAAAGRAGSLCLASTGGGGGANSERE